MGGGIEDGGNTGEGGTTEDRGGGEKVAKEQEWNRGVMEGEEMWEQILG